MAEYYVEPGLYTYSATPTWGTQAMDGDGDNGTGFVAGTITLSGGAITAIAITTAGSGYNTNTRVYVSGTGSGAVISVASVDGSGGITGFTITNGGTGWTGTPTITLVPGASTPATVSVDMSTWTFSTSSTVTVMGATAVTCTSSATSSSATATPNAQYSATLTTMIDNLVTAINFHSGAVNTANLPSGWLGHQVRNTVYARRNGDSLELMTRAGSRHYNTLTCLSFANVTNSSSQTWSSGKSGALMFFNNTSTILPSAIAAASYGIQRIAANECSLALKATTVRGDIFHIRANNVTQALGQNHFINFSRTATFLVDDGEIWKGDTGTYKVTADSTTNPSGITMGASFAYFGARTLGRFVFEGVGSGNAATFSLGSTGVAENVLATKESTINQTLSFAGGGNASICALRGCKLLNKKNEWQPFFVHSGGQGTGLTIENCEYELTNFTGSATYFLDTGAAGDYKEYYIRNCKVTFGATPSAKPVVFRSFAYSGSPYLVAENVEGCEIKLASAGTFGNGSSGHNNREQGRVLLQNIGPKRSFRLETFSLILDWIYGQDYPYADSYLPEGTPWSYRFLWGNDTDIFPSPGGYVYRAPLPIISLTKTYTASNATRTIDLELLVPSAHASSILVGALTMNIVYVNSSGNVVRQQSAPWWQLETGGASALASSSKSWTLGSTYTSYVARKLSITTTDQIKQNTEIEAQLIATCLPPATIDVFINPELTIT